MPSADCCTVVRVPPGALSPLHRTRHSSPEVSSATFRAQPPDLRFTPLMDMDFTVTRPLVRRWRLVSGSYPSARTLAPRFLRTSSHDDALAVHRPFTSIRLGRGLAPPGR